MEGVKTVFALFEALARDLHVTLVLPPIVCRCPFANDEFATFWDEIELDRKLKELAAGNDKEFLRRRQMQESW